MKRHFAAPGTLFVILLTLTSLVGSTSLGVASAMLSSNTNALDETNYQITSDEPEQVVVNLPIIRSDMPLRHFGGEANWYSNTIVQDRAREANIQWMRVLGFSWTAIEPELLQPRQYDWTKVNEAALLNLAQRNFRMIGVVRFTPLWAQMIPDVYCGPVASEYLDEFAEFMAQLVRRYSIPPYNILHWEIGNEPDVAPIPTPGEPEKQIYGCWGDPNDPYFGGGHYAEMLKKVYPAIKAANPQAKVVIGGLLLDCDPYDPTPPARSCLPSMFLEGILKNQGGAYFDFANFHGYVGYWGLIADERFNDWDHRGGVVLGKIDFLKTEMAKYNVNKPILQTEGALLCYENNLAHCNPPGSDFYETQADYVIWLFVRNWAIGNIPATIWYTVDGPGWRYGGLLDSSQQPKPAYYAYQFLTQQLGAAEYTGQITGYTGIRIFAFVRPTKRIWVAWAPDETPYQMTLPSGVIQVLDKYGAVIEPVDNQITVKSPVYIELTR